MNGKDEPAVGVEARALLRCEMARYRSRSYADLVRMIGAPDDYSVVGDSGRRFGVEVEAFWDSAKGGDLRVVAGVDSNGISTSRPICKDFIIRPDGSLVGE